MTRTLQLILALLLLALPVRAVTLNVACDPDAIYTAFTVTAQEGDTVLIGPGDCTIWETWIDRNISFTIAGSGTNLTTLRSGANNQAIWVQSKSTNLFTIRDINCVGHAANSGGFFILGRDGFANGGFYHVYNIKMTNVVGHGISIGRGQAKGLIDHCYFVSQPGNPQPIEFYGDGYASWASPNPLGTDLAAYVEDCYFDNGNNNGNGFFDAYDGSQLVFRHNFCNGNAPTGVHGYDSQATSGRTWEVYNNIFTNITPSVFCLQMRGGTGVVFSNTVSTGTGTGGGMCELMYYRACDINDSVVALYGFPGRPVVCTYASNPVDTQLSGFGQTKYRFVSSLSGYSGPVDVYGGGFVKIGATTAETMTNLYACMKLGAGVGTAYATGAQYGHDFLPYSVQTNGVTLRNALDGNQNAFGYPANQQHAVLFSYPLSSSTYTNPQVMWPCYAWGNTLNGVSENFTLQDDTDICSHNITNLTKLGRDYFNTMPAPEVYTPYVYPHPLQVFTVPPTVVTNLVTVVRGLGTTNAIAGGTITITATNVAPTTFTGWTESGGRLANNAVSPATYLNTNAATFTANYYTPPVVVPNVTPTPGYRKKLKLRFN